MIVDTDTLTKMMVESKNVLTFTKKVKGIT